LCFFGHTDSFLIILIKKYCKNNTFLIKKPNFVFLFTSFLSLFYNLSTFLP
jgi:hypothetical protein